MNRINLQQWGMLIGSDLLVMRVGICKLIQVNSDGSITVFHSEAGKCLDYNIHDDWTRLKPIRKRVDNLNEEENNNISTLLKEAREAYEKLSDVEKQMQSQQKVWFELFRMGVDIFGWIALGLAVHESVAVTE